MERELAKQNALSVLCYLMSTRPEWLSVLTNYTACYEVECQVKGEKSEGKKIVEQLKQLIHKEATILFYNSPSLSLWIIRITWRVLS